MPLLRNKYGALLCPILIEDENDYILTDNLIKAMLDKQPSIGVKIRSKLSCNREKVIFIGGNDAESETEEFLGTVQSILHQNDMLNVVEKLQCDAQHTSEVKTCRSSDNYIKIAQILHSCISKKLPLVFAKREEYRDSAKSRNQEIRTAVSLDEQEYNSKLFTICVGDGIHCISSVLYATLHSTSILFFEHVEDFLSFLQKSKSNICDKNRKIAIFAGLEQISTSHLWKIYDLLSDDCGYQTNDIGIMTALRPQTTIRNIVISFIRSLIPLCNDKSMLVLPISNIAKSESIEDIDLFSDNVENMVEKIHYCLTHHTYNFMGFTGHSSFCHLSLSKKRGAICPYVDKDIQVTPNSAKSTLLSEKYLPDCMSLSHLCSFEKNIPVNKARAFLYNVPEIIFNNGCATVKFADSWYDPAFSIGFQFLETGAISYIGTIKLKFGTEFECLLALDSLRKGNTLGEIVRTLNSLSEFCGNGKCYVLIGDPLLSLGSMPDPLGKEKLKSYGNNVTVTNDLSNRFTTEHSKLGISIRVQLNEHTLQDIVSHKVRLRVDTKDLSDTRLGLVPDCENNCFTVYVFPSSYTTDKIHIRIGMLREETRHALEDITNGTSQNMDKIQFLKIGDGKIRGLKQDLLGLLANLSEKHYGLYGMSALDERTTGKIMEKIDNINRHIALRIKAVLSERPKPSLEEIYGECLSYSETIHTELNCPYCKNKIVLRRLYNPFISTLTRIMGECLRCGPVFDVPQDLFGEIPENNGLCIQISCKESLSAGNQYKTAITIKNVLDKYLRCLLHFYVLSPPQISVPIISPQTASFTLSPKESHEVLFRLEVPSNASEGTRYLTCTCIANGDVLFSCRTVFVKNKSLSAYNGALR